MSVCSARPSRSAVDARQLSSGTMSKVCRDFGILHEYQLGQCEWLDAVQAKFALFCGTKLASECRNWQDAFEQFAKRYHHVRRHCWKSGFQGSTDYIIDGTRYEAVWCKDSTINWNGDYFEEGLKRQIGTVFLSSNMTLGFPPDDVICCFPELVPLRAECDPWRYVYDERFGEPKQRWGTRGWDNSTLYAELKDDTDLVDYETDPKLIYLRTHFRGHY